MVAFQVSVGNGGPDDATGVTVTDTATNGTVQSASGSNWTCGNPVEDVVTCTYDLTLDGGTSAEDLTVLVKASANPGTADVAMSDTATVSGNEFDPNADNDSDTETTPITGSGSAFAKDHASTFFDGVTTTTLETTRDTAGGFYSRLVIPGNSGLLPGPVTIDEFNASLPAFDGFCGGKDCDAQVQITVLPFGRTPANNPIQVFWFYPKDTKQGSTAYVKGDNETLATVVRNCSRRGHRQPAEVRQLEDGPAQWGSTVPVAVAGWRRPGRRQALGLEPRVGGARACSGLDTPVGRDAGDSHDAQPVEHGSALALRILVGPSGLPGERCQGVQSHRDLEVGLSGSRRLEAFLEGTPRVIGPPHLQQGPTPDAVEQRDLRRHAADRPGTPQRRVAGVQSLLKISLEHPALGDPSLGLQDPRRRRRSPGTS